MRPETVRAVLASAAAYFAVTLALGRQVLGSLTTRIASDAGDPLLNAAILAWNAVHVPWTDAWYQFPIFFPTTNVLTLSEHLLGVSLIASPVYWATGNPITAYNVALLLSYPLSGLAMFALVWRLTHSAPAAFLAGLAFAFSPYRASQLPHIQMQTLFWAPLALLGLHAFASAASGSAARWGWLAFFAVCWLLQGAANGYMLVYFSAVVGLWMLWFVISARRWRDALLLASAIVAAALPLAPILGRYVQTHGALGLSRNLGEIAFFGADIAAPLCAPASLTFWGWLRVACAPEGELFAGVGLIALCLAAWRPMKGRPTAAGAVWRSGKGRPAAAGAVWHSGKGRPAAAGAARRSKKGRPEDPGAPRPDESTTPVDESPFAERRAVRVVRIALLFVAMVYATIAISVLLVGPWRIDLGWLRASASDLDKPLSVALACLLAAFALSPRFTAMIRGRSAATFYLLAAAICWVLSWGPFPRLLGADALYQAPFAWLLQLPGVDGLRVPARFWMMTVLCLCVFAGIGLGQRFAQWGRGRAAAVLTAATIAILVDGWMTIPAAAVPAGAADAAALRGNVVLTLPAGSIESDVDAVYEAVTGQWTAINGYSGYEPGYYEALRTLAQDRDDALFDAFVTRGDILVVVADDDSAARAFVERQPGVQAMGRMAGSDPGRVQYRVPMRAVPAASPVAFGERARVFLLTASCSPESLPLAVDTDTETRWVCGPQIADHRLAVDLGSVVRVGVVVHTLGSAASDFPRNLVIETSVDGSNWEAAWEGSPARAVLAAAMPQPRLTRVVLPFSPRPARYVRLQQTGRDPRTYWSIAELEIWSGS